MYPHTVYILYRKKTAPPLIKLWGKRLMPFLLKWSFSCAEIGQMQDHNTFSRLKHTLKLYTAYSSNITDHQINRINSRMYRLHAIGPKFFTMTQHLWVMTKVLGLHMWPVDIHPVSWHNAIVMKTAIVMHVNSTFRRQRVLDT